MPIDKLKYLGTCMREARLKASLTQEELSERSHVSVRQIAIIEKGVMNPSYEILYTLIHVLGVSPDILFYPKTAKGDRLHKAVAGCMNLCSLDDQTLILKMVQCLSRELSDRTEI